MDYSSFPPTLMDDLSRFLEGEPSRQPGEDIYPDVFASGQLFPLQRPAEMRRMMQEARRFSPRVVYEIGSDKGGSLYHWCKCLPSVSRVIACEVRGTPYKHLFEKTFPHIDFLWVEESSYDDRTVERVHQWLKGDTLDVLFIDGDKGAFDRDFHCYAPMVKRNGVIFFHDINEPGNPLETFEKVERVGYYATQRIIDLTDTEQSLERERLGIPPANPHEDWVRFWRGRSAGVGVVYMPERV